MRTSESRVSQRWRGYLSAPNKFQIIFSTNNIGFCADRLDKNVKKGYVHLGPAVLLLTWQEDEEEKGPWRHANIPHRRGLPKPWFSVKMTEVAAFKTYSVAFERRRGNPDCREWWMPGPTSALSLSVGLGAWWSARCEMEGEPSQILSFMKAAMGVFPTWNACWKHLAHEEYLADEPREEIQNHIAF